MAESKQEQTSKTTEKRAPDGSASVDTTERTAEVQKPEPEPTGHAQTGASEARERSVDQP